MLNDLWHLEHRTMSQSGEFFGVDEPLLTLEEQLAVEVAREVALLWLPVTGLLRLDCVCSCMTESLFIVGRTVEVDSV